MDPYQRRCLAIWHLAGALTLGPIGSILETQARAPCARYALFGGAPSPEWRSGSATDL
jgi:hypothetical protein